MRSTPVKEHPVQKRRAWEAPAITELPVATQTRARTTEPSSVPDAQPPAAPTTKLGFSFEMSFPLAVRTDS